MEINRHKISMSAIILTFNEESNIEECLKNIYGWVSDILIVDSYSTDRTLEIARKYTDKIYQHPFENHAKQFNWALQNLPLKTEWVMRIDADERWTNAGFEEMIKIISDNKIDGIYVKMKIFFMGKWIKHGDFYPNYFLRVFKRSKSFVENRWMDEHIKVNGKTIISNIDVLEQNYDRQKNISLLITKHNQYSTREAVEALTIKYNMADLNSIGNLLGNKTEKKRWLKEKFYYKLPIFIRPALYFIYRYLFRLGFLDGIEGLVFHFIQGLWYRFLVDAKIYQIEKESKKNNEPIVEVIKELYNIKLIDEKS